MDIVLFVGGFLIKKCGGAYYLDWLQLSTLFSFGGHRNPQSNSVISTSVGGHNIFDIYTFIVDTVLLVVGCKI